MQSLCGLLLSYGRAYMMYAFVTAMDKIAITTRFHHFFVPIAAQREVFPRLWRLKRSMALKLDLYTAKR